MDRCPIRILRENKSPLLPLSANLQDLAMPGTVWRDARRKPSAPTLSGGYRCMMSRFTDATAMALLAPYREFGAYGVLVVGRALLGLTLGGAGVLACQPNFPSARLPEPNRSGVGRVKLPTFPHLAAVLDRRLRGWKRSLRNKQLGDSPRGVAAGLLRFAQERSAASHEQLAVNGCDAKGQTGTRQPPECGS